MNRTGWILPPGADILDASGRGGTGNVTLRFHDRQPPLVLKLYRTRRSIRRQWLHDFSDRWLEGKRGARPLTRWATERAALTIWRREGFDVPETIDQPLPDGLAPPAMWLEWIDGRLLSDHLQDPDLPIPAKLDRIAAYAATSGRRHRRAIETHQTLLIHEHAAPAHVFVSGDRLVTFDMENAYAADFSVAEAAAQEIAGFLFAMDRLNLPDAALLRETYVRAYGQDALLHDLARRIVAGRGWYRRIKRWSDERRRHGRGKTAVMASVLSLLPRR